MSHSDNIKFPLALVVQQNKQCSPICVHWICPPNKSSDFYSLLYFLWAAKLLLFGHQTRVINSWNEEQFPHPTCFIERATIQLSWSESNYIIMNEETFK